MVLKKSNLFKISIAIVVLGLLSLLCAHSFVKYKIKQHLQENLPQHLNINYNSISLNLLVGNVSLDKIVFKEFSTNNKAKTVVKADKIAVKNIGYIPLLFHNKISLGKLEIDNPELTYYTGLETHLKHKKEGALENIISIDEFKSTNGNIIFLNDKEETVASAEHIFITLKDVAFKTDKKENNNPIKYSNGTITAQKLYSNLGKFEAFYAKSLVVKNELVMVHNLQLKTKYTKEKLSKNIITERDFINLKIEELKLENTSFNYAKSTSILRIPIISIIEPNLEVYRDKLIADDLSYKPMYSKMLRELPLKISVDSVLIKQGQIAYQEKLEQHIKPEKLSFNKVNASISNLNNDSNKRTIVRTNSLLMNKTPLALNWSFDIHKKSDSFTAWGSFTNLDIASINPFLNTNLRVTAEGDMQRMYFTFSGTKQTATGDLKIKYNNFKFKILKKDRLGVNKLLTKLGNLIIKEGSKSNPKNFRYGKIKVERDTTKSFFNYLWISIKGGLLDALTGKGIKEE